MVDIEKMQDIIWAFFPDVLINLDSDGMEFTFMGIISSYNYATGILSFEYKNPHGITFDCFTIKNDIELIKVLSKIQRGKYSEPVEVFSIKKTNKGDFECFIQIGDEKNNFQYTQVPLRCPDTIVALDIVELLGKVKTKK